MAAVIHWISLSQLKSKINFEASDAIFFVYMSMYNSRKNTVPTDALASIYHIYNQLCLMKSTALKRSQYSRKERFVSSRLFGSGFSYQQTCRVDMFYDLSSNYC